MAFTRWRLQDDVYKMKLISRDAVLALWGLLRGVAFRQDGKNSHDFDRPILGLNDFHGVTRDFKACTRLRDIFEMLHNKPVEGLRPPKRQVEAELAVQVAKQAAAFHNNAVVSLFEECADL